MRLIDGDAAKNEYFAAMKELLKATTSNLSDDAISLLAGYSIMDNAPTINAVLLIRCKDCEYSYFADNRVPAEQSLVCERTGCDVTPDWFCAAGKCEDGRR